MRVEESIRIAAPREEVWPFISQPGCYSQFMVNSTWSPVEGEPTSGLRARWNTEIGVGSINLSSLVEFVEWDPPGLPPAHRGDPAGELPGSGRGAGAGREPARQAADPPRPAPLARGAQRG